jgi:hypothetical protein
MITNVKDLDFGKRRLSKLTNKKQEKAFVISDAVSNEKKAENLEMLRVAEMYWSALKDFRDRRKRNRKYYRGDQWHETITNPDYDSRITDTTDSRSYQTITEEEYIINQGKIPFKQNLIRQLGKNILGQYRANPNESIVIARAREKASEADIMSNALIAVRQMNSSRELEARNCEEFTLSGACFTKIGYKYIKERDTEDVWIQNVNPNRMYFNNDINDIRLSDLNVIGEIIDTTIDNIIAAFAKTPSDEGKIRRFYANQGLEPSGVENTLTPSAIDNLNFYAPDRMDKCRLIEHWYLKTDWRIYAHDYLDGSYSVTNQTTKEIDSINILRIAQAALQGIPPEDVPQIEYERKKEQFWCVKYLTPYGDCLWEGESPYAHQEHPYVATLYPLLDGEVWSIIEDVIDQQRYINRLIALFDFIMGASAKGVLFIDENLVDESAMDIDEIMDEWVKFNGVIRYRAKPGIQVPYQISSNSTTIGISDMIQLQMKLFQDISGVSDAVQGRDPRSGTPASLYAQVAQNSTINIRDFFETYAWNRQRIDYKIIKVIRQFYKDERYIAVAGRSYNTSSMIYNPNKIKDVEFDVSVTPSTDTPVYRSIIEDTLKELLGKGLIDIEMYLESTSMPLADQLLEKIKLKKQQISQGQPGGELPPELVNQIQSGTNPQAQVMIDKLFQNQGQN